MRNTEKQAHTTVTYRIGRDGTLHPVEAVPLAAGDRVMRAKHSRKAGYRGLQDRGVILETSDSVVSPGWVLLTVEWENTGVIGLYHPAELVVLRDSKGGHR